MGSARLPPHSFSILHFLLIDCERFLWVGVVGANCGECLFFLPLVSNAATGPDLPFA